MWVLAVVALVTCVAVALRGTRWAQAALRTSRWTYLLVPASLLYFPYKSGFRVQSVACQWTFDFDLAIHSFRNIPHIVMFAVFFLLTYAQLPNVKRAMAWSFAVCLMMGFLVEIAQGATRIHHCRMRDLIPDMAGASIGALIVLAGRLISMTRRQSITRA